METNAALRRKLLRGSLAAPVVLTVSSASAATTSFGRCLVNNNTTASPYFASSASADNWYRQPVKVVEIHYKGVNLGWFYDDPSKSTLVSCMPPYMALPFSSAMLAPGAQITNTSTRWALVWFDKATTLRTKYITPQQPFGSISTTMSCYGSFTRT